MKNSRSSAEFPGASLIPPTAHLAPSQANSRPSCCYTVLTPNPKPSPRCLLFPVSAQNLTTRSSLPPTTTYTKPDIKNPGVFPLG